MATAKKRMFTSDEWREQFEKASVSASVIEKEVGIPKTVFLRAIQPEVSTRVPIPFKYELPLYKFLKSKIVEPAEEVIMENNSPEVSEEEKENKLWWLGELRKKRAERLSSE